MTEGDTLPLCTTSAATQSSRRRHLGRRTAKACQVCQSRKVKCEITEHGPPCFNCLLDGIKCVETKRAKRKRNCTEGNFPRGRLDLFNAQEILREGLLELYAPRETLLSVQRYSSIPCQTSPALCRPGGSATCSITAANQSEILSLPAFIKPLPLHIGPDEIDYLNKKGALTIPSLKLRNELLRCYVEYVHFTSPVLDLHEFVSKFDHPDRGCGMLSLVLFHAVMFAGSAVADLPLLQAEGYETRKEARKGFFNKAVVLYDLDCEPDHLTLTQALTLLAQYYEIPDGQKDTWHWAGAASSLAQDIGLHRNPSNHNVLHLSCGLRKRIWWSIYMADCHIALGMRRPMWINADDFDVPMLTLEDFNISTLMDSVSCLPLDCALRSIERQKQLACICIEQIKLSICLSNVLSKLYHVQHRTQGAANNTTTLMLRPKTLDPAGAEIQQCDAELQRWMDELPEQAKYCGIACVEVQISHLHAIFHATVATLHRPRATMPTTEADHSTTDIVAVRTSRAKMRFAAAAITEISRLQLSRDLVRYLPGLGITVLLPAIISHLLDFMSQDKEAQRQGHKGVAQCMLAMNELRDTYAAADYATRFIEATACKLGLDSAPLFVDGSEKSEDIVKSTSPLSCWSVDRLGQGTSPSVHEAMLVEFQGGFWTDPTLCYVDDVGQDIDIQTTGVLNAGRTTLPDVAEISGKTLAYEIARPTMTPATDDNPFETFSGIHDLGFDPPTFDFVFQTPSPATSDNTFEMSGGIDYLSSDASTLATNLDLGIFFESFDGFMDGTNPDSS